MKFYGTDHDTFVANAGRIYLIEGTELEDQTKFGLPEGAVELPMDVLDPEVVEFCIHELGLEVE